LFLDLTVNEGSGLMQLELEYARPHMTIKERVLWMLRRYDSVTTTEFLAEGLYTFRNRISELKRKGYRIDAQKIEGKSIYRYRLVS